MTKKYLALFGVAIFILICWAALAVNLPQCLLSPYAISDCIYNKLTGHIILLEREDMFLIGTPQALQDEYYPRCSTIAHSGYEVFLPAEFNATNGTYGVSQEGEVYMEFVPFPGMEDIFTDGIDQVIFSLAETENGPAVVEIVFSVCRGKYFVTQRTTEWKNLLNR